jgi:hypothetical protein
MIKRPPQTANDLIACRVFGVQPIDHPHLGGFALTCYENNTANELLEYMKTTQIPVDICSAWGMSPKEVRHAIREALEQMMYDVWV